MYLSFYDLTFYQLPGVMLSFVFSFLIFYFIYYKINFSKNIYVRLLQKFVVFNLCFISSVLLASLLDLYIFQVFFSEVNINNVNDFINIVCSSPNESYEIKIPKTPIDIMTKAVGDALSNISSNIGAASAGGLVGSTIIKSVNLPPLQKAALGVATAGVTSGAVT